MKHLLKFLTALVSIAAIFAMCVYLFGTGRIRALQTPLITAFANMDTGGPLQDTQQPDIAEDVPLPAEEAPAQHLQPYPQAPSMFPDMDVQYAYLLIQQWLERSYLKDNAVLSFENGNEFVIRCWSPGMGLELTEALANNQTRLDAWQDAVNSLWDLDAFLSRDIKESLGTNMSVTFQIVDDVHPEAVLLKIKDGFIEYDLLRDGTAPDYEVYDGN